MTNVFKFEICNINNPVFLPLIERNSSSKRRLGYLFICEIENMISAMSASMPQTFILEFNNYKSQYLEVYEKYNKLVLFL